MFENPRHKQSHQYFQHQIDGNPSPQRSGLLPTDKQDTYKRSPHRASRRSRNERTSYLMATGHLDPEETQHLNRPPPELAVHLESSDSISATKSNSAILHRDNSEQRAQKASSKRPSFEPSFLDNLNRALANSPVNGQSSFEHQPTRESRSKSPRSSKKSKSKGKQSAPKLTNNLQRYEATVHDNNGRGKFRQTYTEVTLPMKTSPAFDYILKDNRRRNKRCCLWFLYSVLILTCLMIIAWASFMLARSAHK